MPKLTCHIKAAALLFAAVLCLAACAPRHGQDDALMTDDAWARLEQCAPSLSVAGNAASCGLYARARRAEDEIRADVRLQRLEEGAYQTVRLWYGEQARGTLFFADKCWLNESGSYRLLAEVSVNGGEPVILHSDLRLGAPLPARPDGEELDYRLLSLFRFELAEAEGVFSLPPVEIEELLRTARTEADRYYNAAPGLLLQSAGQGNTLLLREGELRELAAAMAEGRINRLALGLPRGRVCFLEPPAGQGDLLARLDERPAVGLAAGLNSGAEPLQAFYVSVEGLAEPADMLICAELNRAAAAAWAESAARPPSEPMETPLYSDLAVFYLPEDGGPEPLAAADFVYGLAGDTESRPYARLHTDRCGLYLVVRVPGQYDGAAGSWYADYANYLAARRVIAPARGFDAGRPATRGELAQMLCALGGGAPIADVARAASWAGEQGLLTGFEDGSLRPEAGLTRQELLVMLWRFVARAGACLPHTREDISYLDRRSIGGFAREAVSAFSEAGLAPRENWRRLGPNKAATLGEAARLTVLVNRSVLDSLERFVVP